MKKLNKFLAVITALAIALSMMSLVSVASDSVPTIYTKDTVVTQNNTLTNVKTGSTETFSYSTPSGGATILVFFNGDGTCLNSSAVFEALNDDTLVGNSKINIIAINGNGSVSVDDVDAFMKKNASDIYDDITIYTGGNSLMFKYINLLGLSSVSYAFVVCIDSSGYITSYSTSVSSTLHIQVMVDCLSELVGTAVDVTVSGTKHYEYVADVVSYANAIRANDGVYTTLTLDADLTELAMQRAAEIALYYSHTRPNGTSCSTVFASTPGVSGENIAVGFTSASAVSDAWDKSEGHHANIVSTSYSSIGVGCFESNGVMYWVQIFSSESASSSTTSTSAIASDVSVSVLTSLLNLSLSSTNDVTLEIDDTTTSAKLYSLNAGLLEEYSVYSYALLKPTITINSSDTIVTVTEGETGSGTSTLTGVSEGTGTITYTAYSGQTDGISVALTVSDPSTTPVEPAQKYSISISETTNGTVTASPETAAAGDTVALTITPAEGYEVSSVTVTYGSGTEVTVAADYTFTMPENDVTVTVVFAEKSGGSSTDDPSTTTTYTVTTTQTSLGTVTVTPTSAEAGATVTVKVTANTGYTVAGITVKDVSGSTVTTSGSNGVYTFTMPSSAVTITPLFTADSSSSTTEHTHTYVFVGWTWSSDLNSAIGTFYCSTCGNKAIYPATVTSSTTYGVVTKNAAIYLNGVWYTDSKIDISSTSSTSTSTTNTTTTTTTETVDEVIQVEDPIESTETDTEPDDSEPEEVAEPETDSNPTTGIAISLIPMAIAALAAVSSKRR